MKPAMDSLPPHFERDLAQALRRDAARVVPGFSQRVVQKVQSARLRQKVIRWTSLATSLAACFIAVLTVSRHRAENFLVQQSQALVMSDDAANFNAIFSGADDLTILVSAIEEATNESDDFSNTEI